MVERKLEIWGSNLHFHIFALSSDESFTVKKVELLWKIVAHLNKSLQD